MSHTERYPKAENFDLNILIPKLRKSIGTLAGSRLPSTEEVTQVVESEFSNLLTHEQEKLIEAFIQNESAAADKADTLTA